MMRMDETMVDRLTPHDVGTIFEGSALRTADELAVTVIRWAFLRGMPADSTVSTSPSLIGFDVADRSVSLDDEMWEQIDWYGDNAGDLANAAQEWLNGNVAPDGFEFVWDDGFVLRPESGW